MNSKAERAFRDIPRDIKKGVRAMYEGSRAEFGLSNLIPWDELSRDEQLMFCGIFEAGHRMSQV